MGIVFDAGTSCFRVLCVLRIFSWHCDVACGCLICVCVCLLVGLLVVLWLWLVWFSLIVWLWLDGASALCGFDLVLCDWFDVCGLVGC